MPQENKSHEYETVALIALGSNAPSPFGSPAKSLRAALADLATESIRVIDNSQLYHTPCFPAGASPDYVNAVARVVTRLTPEELLLKLHDIERRFGRERLRRWGARSLDLDLLAYGDHVLPDPEGYAHWRDLPLQQQQHCAPKRLILPHPRMHERAFVLVPLAEIAPDWRHPVSGLSVREMLESLPEEARAEVRPL